MWIKALILGIIEGLTEFLPVSSTGHLIIFSNMLSLRPEFDNVFNIVIQMGAILSVVFYFWKEILPKEYTKSGIRDFTGLWSKVIIATVPAVLLALKFEDEIDKYLFNPVSVAVALILGGFWIMIAEGKLGKSKKNRPKVVDIRDLSYIQAFKIGCFQCLALIPGASRSAMTIIGGLYCGTSRELAAKFSFFMAIPVLMGAGLLKLLKNVGVFTTEELSVLGFGSLVSFIVAYLVIALFMSYIKKHRFTLFAYYRIVLGIIVLVHVYL